MKYLIFIITILCTQKAFAQAHDLQPYQHYLSDSLKDWVVTFKDFHLSDFKRKDSLLASNNDGERVQNIDSLLSILKPILTFNEDSTQFIDIYSGQANISKEGNHLVANPDDGGAVCLCNTKLRYRKRIFYNSPGSWVEEVVWVSKTKFILAGITKNENGERMPLLIVGDAIEETLFEYTNNNNSCIQKTIYNSPKLKKVNIRGM